MKKAGHIVKISEITTGSEGEDREKYLEYCINQVEKEISSLGLKEE